MWDQASFDELAVKVLPIFTPRWILQLAAMSRFSESSCQIFWQKGAQFESLSISFLDADLLRRSQLRRSAETFHSSETEWGIAEFFFSFFAYRHALIQSFPEHSQKIISHVSWVYFGKSVFPHIHHHRILCDLTFSMHKFLVACCFQNPECT